MKKDKKEIIETVLIVIFIIIVFSIGSWYSCHYTRDCVVVSIDKNDTVMVVDEQEHYWEFYGKDYKVGQVVRLTFFTNHTDDDILDDKIIEAITK